MAKFTRYTNPPLSEAVFELFYKTNTWSPIIPGLFYNEIKERFPNISSNPTGFGIIIDPQGIKVGGGNSELTQYKTPRNDSIVQLTNGLLTVNKLPPYESWDSYKDTIKFAIEAFKKSFPSAEIIRVGLKFINKINIGDTHSLENFKNFFTIIPLLPKSFGNNINSIQINLESPLIPETEILAISTVSLKKEPGYDAPVMFQIYLTRIKDLKDIVIEDWIEQSYKKLYETFDDCLTKVCKNGFNNL